MTSRFTEAQMGYLRRLLDRASPGAYKAEHLGRVWRVIAYEDLGNVLVSSPLVEFLLGEDSNNASDAEFYAAVHDILPALLDEIEYLWAERDSLIATLESEGIQPE